MFAPESNAQARVFEVSVAVSEPSVTVRKSLIWVVVSAVAPVPVTATVKAVVTVLVRSTSPRVSVPEAVRLAALLSVMAPTSEPLAAASKVGASFVPVTLTTKVFVPGALVPSVTVSV